MKEIQGKSTLVWVSKDRVKLQYVYEGNPGEINFGLGQQGFELSGVNCKPPSKMVEINRLPNLFTNCQSQITFMSVTVDLFVLCWMFFKLY